MNVCFVLSLQDKLQKDKKDRVINAIVEGSTESKLMEFNKWTTGIRQIAKYEV